MIILAKRGSRRQGPQYWNQYVRAGLLGSASSSSKNVTDTGAGSDALVILNSLALSDTGSGVDPLSIAAAITLTESGVGQDIISGQETVSEIIAIRWPRGMGRSRPEFFGQVMRPSLLGHQDDLTRLISETGIGTESVSISVSLSMADTGAGTENAPSALDVALALVEAATGSEAVSAITVSLSLSDTGASTGETVSISTTDFKSLVDSGVGVDSISVVAITVVISDTGSGADSLTTAQSLISIAETAQGADVITVSDPNKKIIKSIKFVIQRSRSLRFEI